MSGLRNLVRNSAANVASGASNALLAIALPPVLVRYLPLDAFSTWAVVLQIAAVVNLFGFGVQVAVGRYVAHCNAVRDDRFRAQIVSTSLAVLSVSAVLALLAVALLAFFLPDVFPGMPADMHHAARLGLLLIGGSLALALPASVAAGVFSGFQRNEIPAIVTVASRVAMGVALIAIAASSANVVPMAAAYAAINVLAAIAQLALLHRRYPELAFRRRDVSASAGRELVGYCFSLTVWSLGMLAISGLDAVIAGHLDFRWAGYFAVAASVVTVLVGLQVAILQPLVAISAQHHSAGQSRTLGELLVESTRINTILCALGLVPFYLFGDTLLKLWVGREFAAQTLPILQVLLLGVYARQTLAPFATILLGTGEQRLVVMTVFYEGATKLAASIALGLWIGPLGVALGTVAGGLVCLGSNLWLNFPRVRGLTVDVRSFAARGIAQPSLVLLPVLVLVIAQQASNAPFGWLASGVAGVTALGAAVIMSRSPIGRLRGLV